MTLAELQRLETIRARVTALGPVEWELASEGHGMQLDVIEGHDRATIARFDRATSDDMQLVASAPADLGFLVQLVDRAISFASRAQRSGGASDSDDGQSTLRPSGEGGSRQPNFAAEAAMKCGEPAFKKFLIDCHGLESPASDDRCAQKLRSVLGVTSRKDLNSDTQAAARWKKLRGAFDAWRRG